MPLIASACAPAAVTGTATPVPEDSIESFEVSLIDAKPTRANASRQEPYRGASLSHPRKCRCNSNRSNENFPTEKRSFTAEKRSDAHAMTVKLITIPFSHYCEKARWALDRASVRYDEDGHLPLFHYLANIRAGGKRTVPTLVVEKDRKKSVVRDSTDIIAWADSQKPGCLIPLAGSDEALAIEDDFDNHFGPATRRWGYYYLLPNHDADQHINVGVPRWEKSLLKVARPLAVRFLKRGLKIDEAGVERSRKKINETFARVDEVLRDGRRFLTGDRFTVADLTFAALAAPILLPAEHPVQKFDVDMFPEEARAQIDQWRHTRAGQFGLRLYADERIKLPRAA
jgi:glutathione S-transferase